MVEKTQIAQEQIGSLVIECGSTRILGVYETESYLSDAERLLSLEDRESLKVELGTLRQLGTIIKDSGGLRKFRWAAKGKGKRGGVRVIYYYGGDHMPLVLLAIYGKSEKADMSSAERKAARKFVAVLNKDYQLKSSAPQLRVVKSRKIGRK